MDSVALRLANALHDGDDGITQTVMPEGVTISAVIEACATRANHGSPLDNSAPFAPMASLPPEPDAVRRGRGFAAGYKNVGFSFGFPERCQAEIHLHGQPDDETPTSAAFFHGTADVGQGVHLAIRQMTAEATGIALGSVIGHFSDTDTSDTSDTSGSASASRLTFMAGNSVLGAANQAIEAWHDGDRPAVGTFTYTPPPHRNARPGDRGGSAQLLLRLNGPVR